ncbi:MAG: hypothetical protein COX57_01425 [Alphaproteobacteria bacterium CG_4_10_14_0_2_um_filter_63_37]|nr:MAG: hypothetical protein COX57_01425 [Alphaproteobacteria bacterium CG_4_10_14_0_2_um_filter_63_37]
MVGGIGGRDWWEGIGGRGLVGGDWWEGIGGRGLVGAPSRRDYLNVLRGFLCLNQSWSAIACSVVPTKRPP